MQTVLFCYGTLMSPQVMAAVIGRRARSVPATLNGFRRALLKGRSYPGLWPAPGAQVDGCCYRLIHRRELGYVDRYEGSGYRRQRITVRTSHGSLRAWVYLPRGRRPGPGGRWSGPHFARRRLRHTLRNIAAWRSARFAARCGASA